MKKVYIFKDIKNKRWTVYDYETKKHLGYRYRVSMKNCEFQVINEKRIKVIKSGKRFPHAWIIGYLSKSTNDIKLDKIVTYNPFKDKGFICQDTIVYRAKNAFLNCKGQVFI